MIGMKEMQQFDVVVLGAGMVGAAAALGFARKGLNVAIVEPYMPKPYDAEQVPDLRVSAISLASENLLRSLGAWENIEKMRVHPYRRLAVWEDEGSRTEFDARDCDHDHMGYMVENRIIQLGIHKALKQQEKVTWFKSYQNLSPETGELTLNENLPVTANLIVVAEGAQSQARQGAGIATTGWQYRQSVLSVTVKCHGSANTQVTEGEIEHGTDTTWQQFVPGGPKAFLPLFNNYAALIWYDQNTKIDHLKTFSKEALKPQIVEAFPAILPDFDIVEIGAFPLTRMHAQQYVKGKMVLVGDSAHTINPLAGQGVNLGFKDVAALLEAVSSVAVPNELGNMLIAYQNKRKPQNLLMMSAMDVIYSVFEKDAGPLKKIRNIGLSLANKMGWAKDKVMRYAMGLD